MQDTPYDLLGGEAGVRRLADAFYSAMDDLTSTADVRRMHGENLDSIKQKLFEYLSGWLGGPPLYAQKNGTVCLTDPHAPYSIGSKERDQWLACMDEALTRVGASADLKQMLKEPFFAVADIVRNQPA